MGSGRCSMCGKPVEGGHNKLTCGRRCDLPQVAEGKPNKKPPKAVTWSASKTNRNEVALEEAYVLWERKVSSSPGDGSLPEKTGDTISESPEKVNKEASISGSQNSSGQTTPLEVGKLKVRSENSKNGMTRENLINYLEVRNIARENTQARFILDLLLDNPEGVCRHVIRERYAEAYGKTIGQGGTRVIQTLRDAGLNIAKNVTQPCESCKKKAPFDKLEKPYLLGTSYMRKSFSKKEKVRLFGMYDHRDAISGKKFPGKDLEIDHRVPVQRRKVLNLEEDVDLAKLSDAEVKKEYQLLTRKNNQIKDRACRACLHHGVKPDNINGIISISEESGGGKNWVEGENDCTTCPFAYPEKFGLPTKPLNCD